MKLTIHLQRVTDEKDQYDRDKWVTVYESDTNSDDPDVIDAAAKAGAEAIGRALRASFVATYGDQS